MDDLLTEFDFLLLDADTRQLVKSRTNEIKRLVRRTARDIIEIGLRLLEVKALLPHGSFRDWLKHEFDWSERSAQNFMRVADVFKSATVADLDIQPKALYLLAAPSTPESARDEAIERAEAGETISHAKARAIVQTHKPDPTEGFEIRLKPTLHEPTPPIPSETHSSFGAWIDQIHNEALAFQNLGGASDLAVMLTASQRQKLAELLEFLQSVAHSSEDLHPENNGEWLDRFARVIQQESEN